MRNEGACLVCGKPIVYRVALLPVTSISRPPRVYVPSGIPVARMLSLIRMIRSAPSILNVARTTEGWMCTPSQIISAFTWAPQDVSECTENMVL